MTTQGIGVAGCGRMGRAMLDVLVHAGMDARGFDIRPPAEHGDAAPLITDDPAAFSQGLRTLITVVRDAGQTDEILFGAEGLVERAPSLETIVISSTLSPRYVRELRDRVPRGIALVDAPMSGAVVAAREGRLSFMLGGENRDLERLEPLFAALGRHFHRMGALGSGMAAKVLNNLLAASSMAMTRLVLEWADNLGIEEDRLLSVIETSSGQNWLASGFNSIEYARDGYEPDNTISILDKDIESALDCAPAGVDLALPRAVQAQLRSLNPRK